MNTERCRQFWAKFLNKCDNRSMMLNADADEIEASDRYDIIDSLPNLANMDIIEVGAGIGRFTSSLAESARSVLATDLIENFLETNRKRNASQQNIKYQVCDALSLKLQELSTDFVFTNWLLMYLSDDDVIHFVRSVLSWLRPGGYLHIRESCTQSSSGRSKSSYHSSQEINPTHYRYSSVYMKLLRNISYRDASGDLYRFELIWASSVPTYITNELIKSIQHRNNWRQVHWLARKISVESETGVDEKRLHSHFSSGWKQEQDRWDASASSRSPELLNALLDDVLSKCQLPQHPKFLTYNGGGLDELTYIDPHHFAKLFDGSLNVVETSEYNYRWLLSKAHQSKDYRVRIFWNKDIQSTTEYWKQRDVRFDAVILIGAVNSISVEQIKNIINYEAPILVITSERISLKTLHHSEKNPNITLKCERILHQR